MKYWYSKLSENMKDKKREYAKNKYHNISEKKKKAKIKRVSKKKKYRETKEPKSNKQNTFIFQYVYNNCILFNSQKFRIGETP